MNIFVKFLTRLLTKKKINSNHKLSKREQEVLALMSEGKKNKEIAYKLGTSEQTIKNHCTHIYLKLDVTSRVEAVVKVLA